MRENEGGEEDERDADDVDEHINLWPEQDLAGVVSTTGERRPRTTYLLRVIRSVEGELLFKVKLSSHCVDSDY